MRSMLFVPGDSDKKLAKGTGSGADALIADLEDSVAAGRKEAARRVTLEFLRAGRGRQLIFVRINALDTPHALDDLACVVTGAPDGIVLPKCASADALRTVDHYLSALEAREGLAVGKIKLLPIVTETARAVFELGAYAGASSRLSAMMWGCEDLAADVGAATNRASDASFLAPFELARALCLYAAAAAGVSAIDTVYADFHDLDGLGAESLAAERLGFSAKAAIHPAQVDVINRAFTPGEPAVAWARKVVAAFAHAPGVGVVAIDGKMIDRPHLRAAERILARAGRGV